MRAVRSTSFVISLGHSTCPAKSGRKFLGTNLELNGAAPDQEGQEAESRVNKSWVRRGGCCDCR
jgi:hypothetical protein